LIPTKKLVQEVKTVSKEIFNRDSLINSSQRELTSSVLSDSTPEQSSSFKPREISYSEIMSYYSPKWLAGVGFVASIFASFQLPMFGFVLSRYMFVLYDL
jgi:hypothetical protein